MSRDPYALCASCTAPMFWAKVVPSGYMTPLQADPDTREPLAITDDEVRGRVQLVKVETDLLGDEELWVVRVLKETEEPDPDKPIWRSHFADCPDSARWRRS